MSETKLKAEGKALLADREHREGVEIMSAHEYTVMSTELEAQYRSGRGFKGKVNLYVCEDHAGCGRVTIYRDMDSGLTPPVTGCPHCKGPAQSIGYAIRESDKVRIKEHLQWYRPTYQEYLQVPPHVRDHLNRGGLTVRHPIFGDDTQQSISFDTEIKGNG